MEPKNVRATPDNVSEIGQIPDDVMVSISTIWFPPLKLISYQNKGNNMEYLEVKQSELIDKPLWWQLRGLSYTASGYGGKIPTTKMVKHKGRLKRIYIMIYSNSGTAYILDGKTKLIIREV